MEKLKELIQQYHRWQGLKDYVEKIEYFLNCDFPSAIGNAKALIESICKTILDEQKCQYTKNDSIHQLVTKTIQVFNLNLYNSGVTEFTRAIVTASKNIGELRNTLDTSSHGQSLLTSKDNQIEELTAYFLISSVELIACFLIKYYEIEHPRKQQKKEILYTDFEEFNLYLDTEYGDANIAGLPYVTSETLFLIDKIAYENKYQEYLGIQNETN